MLTISGESSEERYVPLPVCVLTANFASAFAINASARRAENVHFNNKRLTNDSVSFGFG